MKAIVAGLTCQQTDSGSRLLQVILAVTDDDGNELGREVLPEVQVHDQTADVGSAAAPLLSRLTEMILGGYEGGAIGPVLPDPPLSTVVIDDQGAAAISAAVEAGCEAVRLRRDPPRERPPILEPDPALEPDPTVEEPPIVEPEPAPDVEVVPDPVG